MPPLPLQSSSREHLVGSSNRCADHSPDLRSGAAPGDGRPSTDIASAPADSHISSTNLQNTFDSESPARHAGFDTACASAMAHLFRLIDETHYPDLSQRDLPPPSSMELLQMLMRGCPSSQPAELYTAAAFPPEPFVFFAQRAPAPPRTSGPSPSAIRRARSRRTAHRAPEPLSKLDSTTSSAKRRARMHRAANQTAAICYPTQHPDDEPPDISANETMAAQSKRARQDPPAPARKAPRDDFHWLNSSSPYWRDPTQTDNPTSPDVPCRPRPSTPPGPPPDLWSSPDPPPTDVPVPRDTLRQLFFDPRHDLST